MRTRHPALPEGFADWFDDLRYGGEGRAEAAILAGVAGLVRAQLAEQPQPRLRRQLERWRMVFDWNGRR